MPFCPECKYEYNQGKSKCPDCNVSLIDKLPVEQTVKGLRAAVVPDDSWVGICQIDGQIRSDLVKGALDSNNIPSVVLSSQFRALGSSTGFALGPTNPLVGKNDVLMVPREYRHEAELIIEAVLGEDFDRLDLQQ